MGVACVALAEWLCVWIYIHIFTFIYFIYNKCDHDFFTAFVDISFENRMSLWSWLGANMASYADLNKALFGKYLWNTKLMNELEVTFYSSQSTVLRSLSWWCSARIPTIVTATHILGKHLDVTFIHLLVPSLWDCFLFVLWCKILLNLLNFIENYF